MGYCRDRVVHDHQALAQVLKCSISLDVLQDAVALQCNHTFCRACILPWFIQSPTCPLDRQPVDIGVLQEPNPAFMNMLLDCLLLRCQFTECNVTSTLRDLQEHEEWCDCNPENRVVAWSSSGHSTGPRSQIPDTGNQQADTQKENLESKVKLYGIQISNRQNLDEQECEEIVRIVNNELKQCLPTNQKEKRELERQIKNGLRENTGNLSQYCWSIHVSQVNLMMTFYDKFMHSISQSALMMIDLKVGNLKIVIFTDKPLHF